MTPHSCAHTKRQRSTTSITIISAHNERTVHISTGFRAVWSLLSTCRWHFEPLECTPGVKSLWLWSCCSDRFRTTDRLSVHRRRGQNEAGWDKQKKILLAAYFFEKIMAKSTLVNRIDTTKLNDTSFLCTHHASTLSNFHHNNFRTQWTHCTHFDRI